MAPTTAAAFNTLGLDLVPVACVSLTDILFDFDSSFPHPDVALILGQLPGLRAKHKNAKGQLPPLSVFGHADPVGQDEFNKALSGRRARAIYGLLTHDLKIWNALFNEEWANKGVLPGLRKQLGAPATTPRDQLFQDFMNKSFPSPVPKSEFLAGGADPKGIGDLQGCSDFNPLIVLSTSENQTLKTEERNKQNEPDRRVVVFLFRAGSKVNSAKWPCPAATEGTAKCRKQFFAGPPPGDLRRKSGPVHKEFAKTKDTFACRFFDRIARLSPCEAPPPPVVLGVNPLIFFLGADPAVTAPGAVASAGAASALVSSIDAPKINVAQDIVLVKKSYTNPKRVEVVLKTDTPFDGNAKLTVNNPNTIFFFPTKTSTARILFNGIDNVFKGAQLNPTGPGVTIFAEGNAASANLRDVVLTLHLSGGTKTPGPDAVGRMTAIELLLDIGAPRVNATTTPVPLPQPPKTAPAKPTDKFFLGRPVPIQDDAKIQERAMLMVQPVKTAGFAGLNRKLVLIRNGDKVTTFTQEKPSNTDVVVAQRHTLFSINTATTFFVEGKTESTSARDVEYQLGLDGLDDDGDRVKVTVVHSEIVSNKEPKDVHTVAIVPEKPERKSLSKFFPAPLIVGRNFPFELRPFVKVAVPTAFKWSAPGSTILSLTNSTNEVVKITSTGQSTAENDNTIELLVTTNLGQFLRRHRLTVVKVTIDPVNTGDKLKDTDDLNAIRNPSGIVILSGADQSDKTKVAKIEMVKFPIPVPPAAAALPTIEPDLKWTDDDPRISWWIIGDDGKDLKGKADFVNDEKAKRGTKIQIFGTKEGDVLIQPYSGGFGYGMFRANVVTLKKIKYRASRIFIKAKPPAPPNPAVIGRKPTAEHSDIEKHFKVVNIYLRPAGIEMIPDDSAEVASNTGNNKVGQTALDAKVVTVTKAKNGHFDVEVNDPAMTFQAADGDERGAIRVNTRNEVVSFAFIHSEAGGSSVLATAKLCPANHAPKTRARQPEGAPNQSGTPKAYRRTNFTLSDLGTPSSSLKSKTGIPPNTPADKVDMVVLFPDVNWQPATPATRDVNLLWGVIVPTTNIDSSSSVVAGDAASLILAYANTLAHELGHIFGLGHRGNTSASVNDGLAVPTNENLMHPTNPPPQAENVDIIQVKGIRFSEALFRNP